jgi:HEAT repeat protein
MANGFHCAIFSLVFFLPARPALSTQPAPSTLTALPGSPALPASPAPPALSPQGTFEQVIRDLASPDAGTRLKAAEQLKEAAYPEAAVPLAPLVTDPQDEIQLEAIAAELNIFLADKIVPRKRIGFVIEVRTPIAADAVFSGGPLVLGPLPVPTEVLTALRAGARDENPRVALESLYAFGTLAADPAGAGRRELLRTSGPDLAAMLGVPDPARRFAAARVIGRVFEWRRDDPAADELVGDAVITALNDRDRTIRAVAMQTLGAMRYERSIQALTELFEHFGKGELAEAALDALAHIGHPSSAPLMASQLTARNPAMKGIAIEGLARIGDKARWPEVEAALNAERVESVLVAGSFAAAALSGASIDAIGDVLSRPRLHDQARQYLIELGFGRANAFARYVQDPDARVRVDVADILGLARDPAALAILEPLTRDNDPQVVRAANRAVARLRVTPRPVS